MAAFSLPKFYFSKPVVFILGCTGTGKSKLSIEIAKRFNGEIINADAMQLYEGLDVITNKVSTAEQEGIQHHLLGFLSPLKSLTVCDYKNLALRAIKDVIDRKKLPVIVGGTFYYVESLLYDFTIGTPEFATDGDESTSDDVLGGNPPRKKLKLEEYEELKAELNNLDNEKLYERLSEVDPELAKKVHPNSRRKILRAILVYMQHGETLSSILNKQRSQPGGCGSGGPLNFKNSCLLWVQCDSEVLEKRLNDRVDDMLSRGLVDEMLQFHKINDARDMLPVKGERTGIYQSIGFKEFHEFLLMDEETRESEEGKRALEKGVNLLKIATRQYAKRQQRWLRNRFLRNGLRQVAHFFSLAQGPWQHEETTESVTFLRIPPIYGLDATDVSKWEENVYRIAEDVVKCHLEGKTPSLEPLPVENTKEVIDRLYTCECGTILLGKTQYQEHLKSNKHGRNMRRKIRMEQKEESNEAVDLKT